MKHNFLLFFGYNLILVLRVQQAGNILIYSQYYRATSSCDKRSCWLSVSTAPLVLMLLSLSTHLSLLLLLLKQVCLFFFFLVIIIISSSSQILFIVNSLIIIITTIATFFLVHDGHHDHFHHLHHYIFIINVTINIITLLISYVRTDASRRGNVSDNRIHTMQAADGDGPIIPSLAANVKTTRSGSIIETGFGGPAFPAEKTATVNFRFELIGERERKRWECCETIDGQLGRCRWVAGFAVFAGESF